MHLPPMFLEPNWHSQRPFSNVVVFAPHCTDALTPIDKYLEPCAV